VPAGAVASAQVAPYSDLVSDLTRPFIGRFGAEYDDLFQEGMIKVFQALAKGDYPAKEHIAHGMRDWVRTLEYQTRYTRLRAVSYEEHQELLLKQEEQEPYNRAKSNGGLDYIDTSESELYS
jgi:DNA-directed RNA polymerase specialized sigma subunit